MEEKISIDRAFEIIDKSVAPLPAESVEVTLAGGRILAERVNAWVDLPGADISILDGYAVRSSDTESAGPENKLRLKIAGASQFGNPYEDTLPAGACVKVWSGSIIPESTDAVIGNENVIVDNEEAEIVAEVRAGRGVRKRAEEFRVGEAVAEPGSFLNPGMTGLLISAGWSTVSAIQLPRVRVIAAGDELKTPGRDLEPGDVFPSAASGIVTWCRMIGVSEVRLNVVGDAAFDIQEELPEYLGADLVVTLGGTGLSERDVMIKALSDRGVDMVFRGMQVRPGHYTALGMIDKVPVICLPGGPSAAETMFQLLVRRTVSRLMGLSTPGLPAHKAVLAETIAANGDYDFLARVKLESVDNTLTATPLNSKSLHKDIAQANAILRVSPGRELAPGDQVEVWLTK